MKDLLKKIQMFPLVKSKKNISLEFQMTLRLCEYPNQSIALSVHKMLTISILVI